MSLVFPPIHTHKTLLFFPVLLWLCWFYDIHFTFLIQITLSGFILCFLLSLRILEGIPMAKVHKDPQFYILLKLILIFMFNY